MPGRKKSLIKAVRPGISKADFPGANAGPTRENAATLEPALGDILQATGPRTTTKGEG
jgi:hypothetical protein